MSRFIAQLLIVSLLTLNIAWAGDECAYTVFGDAGDIPVQVSGKSLPNPSNTNFDCDDWCHVWANPVALLTTFVPDVYTSAGAINDDFYTLSYRLLPIPPPFHPPIA